MRAISLWQPWASAIALGSKRIETRHWLTDYRGPLAIHAAKRQRVNELIEYSCYWNWNGALWALRGPEGLQLNDTLPFGALVATCELQDCRPTSEFSIGEIRTPRRPKETTSELYDWTEEQMGDFSPGRYGWVLANIQALPVPVPYVGKQGFFHVPDSLLIENGLADEFGLRAVK